MSKAEKTHPVDKYVGNRIRMQRIRIGMTQAQLGETLGVTFQQVQKYEKGFNRISSSRLVAISNALNVSVSWLFDDAPDNTVVLEGEVDTSLQDFMATREGQRLALYFRMIESQQVRQGVLDFVETLALNLGGTPQ